jgi:membrane protein DedA with SNARE-associated domain
VSFFGSLIGNLEPWLHQYGAAAVFVVLTLESLGLPLPGESLLVAGAVLAGRGTISLPILLVAAWAGSVLGDNIGYLLGRYLGRRLVARFGAKVGLTEARFAKVEAVFTKYGAMTVVIARFFNILRQLNGVVAGTLEMPWWRFLACNAVGAALWVGTWTAAGFYFGRHSARLSWLLHGAGLAGVIVLVVIAAIIAIVIYRKRGSS